MRSAWRLLVVALCIATGTTTAQQPTDAQASAAALVASEKALGRVIVHNGTDAASISRQLAALDVANAQFRSYRQKQCGLQIALRPGDGNAAQRKVECEIALTLERTRHLDEVIATQRRLAAGQ